MATILYITITYITVYVIQLQQLLQLLLRIITQYAKYVLSFTKCLQNASG